MSVDRKYYISIQNNNFLDFLECYKHCGNYIHCIKNKKKIKYAVIYTILKYQNIAMMYYIITRIYQSKGRSLLKMHPWCFNNVAYNIYKKECYDSSVFLLKTKRGFFFAKKYLDGVNVDRECLISTSKKCLDIFWGIHTPLTKFYEKNGKLKSKLDKLKTYSIE